MAGRGNPLGFARLSEGGAASALRGVRGEWPGDEPEGRQEIATGVSPWSAGAHTVQPPRGAAETRSARSRRRL